MNSARRGQLPCRCATTSSISTIRAGGKAPGNEEVARAAKARPGRIVELEIALDVAVGVPAIGEVQHVVMIELVDQRRIVDLHQLLVAVVIGQRDEQVERSDRTAAASACGPSRVAHRGHGVVHQAGHHAPVERRLEPARAHEQRQLLPHLQIGDGLEPAGLRRAPEQRLQEPLAPPARPAPRARAGRRRRRCRARARAAPPSAGRGSAPAPAWCR